MSEKRCSRCKKTKPLSGFSKNRTTKDGYQTECTACQKSRRPPPTRKPKQPVAIEPKSVLPISGHVLSEEAADAIRIVQAFRSIR
jgi:hypothetical protein